MSSGADPAILFPLLFLVGLTALVWLWMYVTRVREIRSRRLRIQDLASARAVNEALGEVAGPSDNLINLFEIPVLFYVLVTLLYVTGASDIGYLAGAWTFVLLRALHSLIHTSYNRVMHRFPVYVLSTLVLWGMWARFGWYLLTS
jgi:hypothetical protein